MVLPSGAMPERTMLVPATDTVTSFSVCVIRASVCSPSTNTLILCDGESFMADAIDLVSPRMIPSALLSIVVVVVVVDDESDVVVVDLASDCVLVVDDGVIATIGAGSATGVVGAIVGIALCD